MFDLNYILSLRDRLFRTERTVAELEERITSLEAKLAIATEELVEWRDAKKELNPQAE